MHVVAVDDNPADLELLRFVLGTDVLGEVDFVGYGTPEAGLAAVVARQPDVLIVDYSLGTMSGFDFLETVREAGIDSPAVLLTGSGNESIAVSALHSGFSDYLAKRSLSASSLKRVIDNVTEKYRLTKQSEAYRTDLEGAVEELAARNGEISTFYHTLAHELKTPLTGAREYVSIVRDGIVGAVSEEQTELLTSAIRSCDQLRHCIDDLFDISRIETGKLQVKPVTSDLAIPVRQGVGCFQKQAEAAGIELSLEIAEQLPVAVFDPQRILQVVNNLVGNAIKFTPRGGSVAVVCEAQGDDYLEVRVSDTGVGIGPDELKHVFERLYQTEGNATVKGGMGLGLHLCDQLVRMNGGEINVTSTPAVGSTFAFTVPLTAIAA